MLVENVLQIANTNYTLTQNLATQTQIRWKQCLIMEWQQVAQQELVHLKLKQNTIGPISCQLLATDSQTKG